MGAEPTVGQIMTREVATVRRDASLDEAARLMRELHVSGLPVSDDEGRILGMLSEQDLVRDLDQAAGIARPRGLLDLLLESAPAGGPSLLELCRNRLKRGRVAEAMFTPAYTVEESASVAEAARRMRTKGINRLPVVDAGGRLVGIVTRADILSGIAGGERRAGGSLHPKPRSGARKGTKGDAYADI